MAIRPTQRSTGVMRALLLAIVSALALASLSGCSAVQVGRLAVGVNTAGDPVLVMASCEGPPSAISISAADLGQTDPALQEWNTSLELDNPDRRLDDPAAIALTDPGDRWTVTAGGTVFEDGKLYEVWAWPASDENLGSVQFDLARISVLGEGEVLYQDGPDDRIVPVAEFIDFSLEAC